MARSSPDADALLLQAAPPAAGAREAVSVPLDELLAATGAFAEAQLVGAGGFGKVFRAPPLPSLAARGVRRPVAVKRLFVEAEGRRAPEVLRDLREEQQLLAKCKHPHLIPLLATCEDPRAPCAIYPLARGGSYEDRLVPTPDGQRRLATLGLGSAWGGQGSPVPLTWQERLRTLRDATAALVYLHTPLAASKPWMVLHGDVKASNILLGRNGHTMLSDVGIAKQHGGSGSSAASESSQDSRTSTLCSLGASTNLKGTPSHLDPIYLQSGKRTKETDGYALGVVVLQTLTGRFPRECGFSEAKLLLQAPSAPERWATSLLDPAARWPLAIAASLAGLVHGLSWERFREDRMPCTAALRELERLASDAAIPNVVPEDEEGDDEGSTAVALTAGVAARACAAADEERSLCMICDDRPHTVRFYPCGHAVVCAVCEPTARSFFNNCCPRCQVPIDDRAVERGAHIGNAPTFAFRR